MTITKLSLNVKIVYLDEEDIIIKKINFFPTPTLYRLSITARIFTLSSKRAKLLVKYYLSDIIFNNLDRYIFQELHKKSSLVLLKDCTLLIIIRYQHIYSLCIKYILHKCSYGYYYLLTIKVICTCIACTEQHNLWIMKMIWLSLYNVNRSLLHFYHV